MSLFQNQILTTPNTPKPAQTIHLPTKKVEFKGNENKCHCKTISSRNGRQQISIWSILSFPKIIFFSFNFFFFVHKSVCTDGNYGTEKFHCLTLKKGLTDNVQFSFFMYRGDRKKKCIQHTRIPQESINFHFIVLPVIFHLFYIFTIFDWLKRLIEWHSFDYVRTHGRNMFGGYAKGILCYAGMYKLNHWNPLKY